MMNRIHRANLFFILTIGLITVDACRKNYYASAEDMAEYGWVLFEKKTFEDYLSSNSWFQDGIAKNSEWKDAYNGLGWSYAKLMVLDSSIDNFEIGLAKPQDTWNPTDIHSEILAGLTFAYSAQGNDGKAIQYGRTFLDSTVKPLKAGWIFSHDSLLNHLDVRVTLAASYFAKGKFDSTIMQITVILDSLSSSEIPVTDTTLIGRKEMAKQISLLQKYLSTR